MKSKNLLVICNNFPDKNDRYIGGIFVKEQIKYLKKYFRNVYVISPVAYGIEYFRKTHHEDYKFANVHVFYPKYFNSPLFYFYFRDYWIYLEKRAILKLIKKEKINFELIHAHFTWPSGAVAAKLKKELNVPVIITEHTSDTFNKIINNRDSKCIDAWKLSDAIIRIRQNDIHLFYSVGIIPGKVHFVPNGYDSDKFKMLKIQDARAKLGLPIEKKIILTVGNMEKVKGHNYLIEAIEQIIDFRKDVICIIIGNGNKKKLEKQIKTAGLENFIMLAGGKPHDEIPILINACDVFVLPSLNEGNPTVMFECLACGKPFVGTKVGGIPEIITSEEYGLLCEPANPKELADKILAALEKDWNYFDIQKYASAYSWDKITNEILEVYSKSCND